MNKQDRDLGMGRAISRRDFVNGVAVAAGAIVSAQAGVAAAQTGPLGPQTAVDYPPLRSGFRGDHQGVYVPAHALRDGGAAPEGVDTGETYDLVVVGGGLSGLSAAWYYREQAGPSARILILENHDDFGGHAKRNEFVVGDRMFVAPGGSLRLPQFDAWNYESSRLVKHLGFVIGDPRDRTDTHLYPSLGMEETTFFSKAVYGKNLLLKGSLDRPTEAFMARAPLSAKLKADIVKLRTDVTTDYLPGLSVEEKITKLQAISYRDYLLTVMGLSPEIMPYIRGVWAIPPDTATAWFALFRGSPGFAGLGITEAQIIPKSPTANAQSYYIPGGNHSIARLILRDLIPDCMPKGDFIDVETARFNYTTLDRPSQATRLRLQSTVVRARHVGAAPHRFELDNRMVEITYVTSDAKAFKVVAKDVVMAGNNNFIPYICPEIDAPQKAALHKTARTINMQVNVLVRNWEAFHKVGASSVAYPRSFIESMSLMPSRSFGALRASSDPSQPAIVGFEVADGVANETFFQELCGGTLPTPGTPLRQQMAAARRGLYAMPYERFERAIRSQATDALGAGGFDPGRDILAITVNRWGHGYAMPNSSLFDDPSQPPSSETGRRKFGRITIANSDASGIDTIDTALNEAARAVRELNLNARQHYPAGIHWPMI